MSQRPGIFEHVGSVLRWWPAILLALSFWLTLAIIIF